MGEAMTTSVDEIFPSSTQPLGDARLTEGGNSAFHNFYNDYSHVADPNLRRRLALSEIDKTPFGLHHVRAVLVAGVGFFLDSYDIFAINLITSLIGLVFWAGNDADEGYGGNGGRLPDSVNQALKASTNSGIMIGMILFGYLADTFGRRKMYGIELIIIICGTFGCAIVAGSPGLSAAALMIVWRVVMGVGIGGDYPLSSVITSEFAPTRWRGAMTAAVFSMQGFGQLLAAIVALIMAAAYKRSYIGILDESQCDAACRLAADRSWRVIVGVGAIPACLALYYRITIPETPRYTFDVRLDVEKADADIRAYVSSTPKGGGVHTSCCGAVCQHQSQQTLNVPKASWSDLKAYFSEWSHLKILIGTSMSWFFLDLAYYGLSLNSGTILHAIGFADGRTLYDQLYNHAVGMIILACAGSIPGYWAAVFTVDTMGRKPLQIVGFLLLTVLFCVMGFKFHDLSQTALLVLYVVGQFIFNAGPNTTTFIVAGECFPTRYRATAHGISAAFGKLGAVIAQVISIPMLQKRQLDGCEGRECSSNLDELLKLFALFMLLGAVFSLLIPEPKGLTLEELSGEARTSYNAGCNGSINLDTSRRRAWNPFCGGQPAGFFYPRSQMPTYTSRQKSRVSVLLRRDSMDSVRHRRSQFWRQRRGERIISTDGAIDPVLDSQSSRLESTSRISEQTTNASGAAGPPVQQRNLPTWGAGWGRIDRGKPAPELDEVQLQDVGSLLQGKK